MIELSILVQLVNLVISAVITWFLYNYELGIAQVTSFLQTLSQLQPLFALVAEGIILLADFVIVFLILSVIFERFESDD